MHIDFPWKTVCRYATHLIQDIYKDNPWWIVFGLVMTIAIGLSFFQTKRKNTRHQRNIARANRVLEKLDTFESEVAKIAYLRKINPFVFEELLLSAFLRKGCKVERNKRYTGDGGIDGKVIYKGQTYLVQAKRYTGHINPNHVYAFEDTISASGAKGGFFVHTGRTSKSIFVKYPELHIVSGQKLLNLIRP